MLFSLPLDFIEYEYVKKSSENKADSDSGNQITNFISYQWGELGWTREWNRIWCACKWKTQSHFPSHPWYMWTQWQFNINATWKFQHNLFKIGSMRKVIPTKFFEQTFFALHFDKTAYVTKCSCINVDTLIIWSFFQWLFLNCWCEYSQVLMMMGINELLRSELLWMLIFCHVHDW